ncbi:HD-GYP domain-containing protein [Rossellomorea vietnamensis]|uniref:HD-GYP domain-containing protein n=1 Tax=Rossellomorea vietnamensis TaxID=218284 RepID=A0A5D4KC58_9BACI|nr:HD-GYP domain-containing protein [Rossellomorea vietnamensis]TYR74967.1 HD-GYP domain-containing protein [Rossellomorea vietnamensis]
MLKNIKDSTLIFEEKRTLKWFLVLFFTISILYDGFFYFFNPFVTDGEIGFKSSFGYILYIILLLLIPVLLVVYKHNQHRIKYAFVISYMVLNLVNDLTIYGGSGIEYTSGNVVELFLIVFSPIFVSELFFLVITGSVILKYVTVAFFIHDMKVIFPAILTLVISSMAYLLLKRILGYVSAIKTSYNKQLEAIVKGIIATLELKDPYTKGHSERVANYALILAKKMGNFTQEELNSFYYACLLHDIGKINIPDHILRKPGRLTKEEFDIVKTHPVVGTKAVEKVENLNDSSGVILSHHERWDGKGYPEGLQGMDIPILARVTAIADAFDAMTSTRSYREALPVGTAFNRILEGKGTQFDPDLIDIFKEVFTEWVLLHEHYQTSSDLILNSRINTQESEVRL